MTHKCTVCIGESYNVITRASYGHMHTVLLSMCVCVCVCVPVTKDIDFG